MMMLLTITITLTLLTTVVVDQEDDLLPVITGHLQVGEGNARQKGPGARLHHRKPLAVAEQENGLSPGGRGGGISQVLA